MSHSENSPEINCPKQLMQLWKECTEAKSPKPSSSGEKPSSSSQEQQPRNSPPQPQEEFQKEMGAQPMDFTDGIEKIRGNKSGEFEKVFDSLHGDHSVTPGSPGLSHRSASSSGGSRRGDSCHWSQKYHCNLEVQGPRGGSIHLEEASGTLIQLKRNSHWSKK